jgi:hypothetical protein
MSCHVAYSIELKPHEHSFFADAGEKKDMGKEESKEENAFPSTLRIKQNYFLQTSTYTHYNTAILLPPVFDNLTPPPDNH